MVHTLHMVMPPHDLPARVVLSPRMRTPGLCSRRSGRSDGCGGLLECVELVGIRRGGVRVCEAGGEDGERSEGREDVHAVVALVKVVVRLGEGECGAEGLSNECECGS